MRGTPACVVLALALASGALGGTPVFPQTRHPATDLLRIEMSLRKTVKHLAGTIGERNLEHPRELEAAATWIEGAWRDQGLEPVGLPYSVGAARVRNIEVRVAGPLTGPVVLIGAHYDSVTGSPGADDNASGIAVLVELSRALANKQVKQAVRCVAFVNEEPPYFTTDDMGSVVYARACKARHDDLAAMISLETLGYFRTTEGSQRYPPLLAALYPSTANFIGVVGDVKRRPEVTALAARLTKDQTVPVELAAFPAELPGISWSDHASFWAQGFPGVMLTDTAPYRNPNYHQRTDLPTSLDYPRMACITAGLIDAVLEMAR